MRSAKALASTVPARACAAANRGLKAALNAPSPKIARKLFGKRKATKKASDIGPAPSTAANRISRTNPVTRERAVQDPTEKTLRNISGIHPEQGARVSGRMEKCGRQQSFRQQDWDEFRLPG